MKTKDLDCKQEKGCGEGTMSLNRTYLRAKDLDCVRNTEPLHTTRWLCAHGSERGHILSKLKFGEGHLSFQSPAFV